MQRTRRSSPSDGIALDDEFRPLACPNCGTDREGPYCHQCGQRYLKDRLTAGELWWIFAEHFLDWEEGVWRTFLKMATSPGTVIRHYLGGKRKTYLNPFSYLLFCAGFYAAAQFIMQRIAGSSGLPGLEQMQKWGMAANNVQDQISLVAYGAVFVVALLAASMRFMFDGQLLNSMEAVVTALYTSGNVFVLSIAVSVTWFALTGNPLPIDGLLLTFAVLFPLCMAHAGYGLFESWSLAAYSGAAPVMTGMVGGFLLLIGAIFISAASGTLTGSAEITPIIPLVTGSIFLAGPVVVLILWFMDLLG